MKRIFVISLCCFSLTSFSQEKKSEIESTLEIFDITNGKREIVYKADQHFEAPNWLPDGKTIYFNSNGKIYKTDIKGGKPILINTGFADKCNNDHGISPDGKKLVVSHHEKVSGKSMIYTLPLEGGTPKLITQNAPSYWHGWSPDGTKLAYCAERNGEYDIYSIDTTGKNEIRLTTASGLDDGPDYSPDGKYIYFNSVRTGKMKIWRMKADGSEQVQLTKDEFNDWFAHPSPDGKWLVFVSYGPEVEGHPANKNVQIRMMSAEGGEIKALFKLFGGQGTINVPSWSPDSKKFAFVSYKIKQ